MSQRLSTLALCMLFTGCAANIDNIVLPEQPEFTTADDNLIPVETRYFQKDEFFTLNGTNDAPSPPPLYLNNLTVKNSSAYDAATLGLMDTGLHLNMDKEVAEFLGVYISNFSGYVDDLMANIATLTNSFYKFDGRGYTFSKIKRFSLKLLPEMNNTGEEIAATITALGGQNVSINSQYNTISYSANRDDHLSIENFIEHIKNSSSLIVFDSWIWEVKLSNKHSSGIRWDQFDFADSNLSISGVSGTGVQDGSLDITTGISYVTNSLNISSIFSFLQSHGSINTLSQPKISVLSGGEATLEVGEEREYVATLRETISGADYSQTSAEKETLITGLKLNVKATYQGESVFSNISLDITDFISFEDFKAGGTVLQLPNTVFRRLKTETRIQPGEFFILAGVTTSKSSSDKAGVPISSQSIGIPVSNASDAVKSELVIVMRPRVVMFKELP